MPPPPPPAATGTPGTAASAGQDVATSANSASAAQTSVTPASELTMLRTHIQTLTDLNNRLQAIRHIPAQLLRPPGSDPHKLESTLLTHGFKELATIAETVRSEKVQDALKAARKSELADPSNLGSNLRRENLKRRRPPSPESPQPYRETESKETSLLPPVESGVAAITLDGLPAYIRAYNQSNKQQQKLHVVAPKKGRRLECPVTLRLMVPNVVTVYLTLDHSMRGDGSLIMVNATAIGSREQKPPHSQSDYMAFQQLSQQLAKVIRSEPTAPLQAYVILLSSYQRLFVDACSNCQRVISAEGHVPPVVRKPLVSPGDIKWDVRHVICKYEPPPPQPNPSENGAEMIGEVGVGEPGGSSSAV
ncbi:hypothetical protein C8Q76DRAFT_606713 [Earliella scabrosa]|nr:hypothetical protein C8Q76DRAFT_606713 [Earliella scabrosa]